VAAFGVILESLASVNLETRVILVSRVIVVTRVIVVAQMG
jgi:hypothetical protein